jgi:hypothetical protein
MKPAELDEIRQCIWAEPWKDPSLFPDLLNRAVTELGAVAVAETGLGYRCEDAERWAADLLRKLGDRARSGIPFGEPPPDDPAPTNPEDL